MTLYILPPLVVLVFIGIALFRRWPRVYTWLTADQADATERIKELNEKATQLLIFMSFAILGAATAFPGATVRSVLRQWTIALFPILLAVLPMKELGATKPCWLTFVRWWKIVLLVEGVVLSAIGTYPFLQRISDP